MLKRTLVVSSRGVGISYRSRCIILKRDGNELSRVPIEDIGLLLVESAAARMSSAALSALASGNVAVILCDQEHMPVAMLHPFAGNQLHAKRVRAQAALRAPVIKQLWQRMVRAKIENQAAFLGELKRDAAARLRKLASEVKSGDRENAEAQAAQVYWKALFRGPDSPNSTANFRRRRDGASPNDLLNYGYMVMRATVARSLVAAGLHPALGIGHTSRSNNFALADDMLEPFRPFVDRRVYDLVEAGVCELTPGHKKRLITVGEERVEVGGEVRPLDLAIQRASFALAGIVEASVKEDAKGDHTSAKKLAGKLRFPKLERRTAVPWTEHSTDSSCRS